MDENEEDAWDISDCQDKSLKLEACIDGLLDLQGSYNVPIIMSTPHFLDADPSLHEAIDGVDPDREKHITFLNIEPTTGFLTNPLLYLIIFILGMSLQAHKRIQVSVPVAKSEYFHDLQNLRDPEDRVRFFSLLISMLSNPWHVVRLGYPLRNVIILSTFFPCVDNLAGGVG